jgi:hypothetical protein
MTALLTHGATRAETTEPATKGGRGRLRKACHRMRLTVQEMNYASRRAVELQAPWSVDDQRYRR